MARGDQIVRQWKILRLLQHSRRGLRAVEIAERLEAHERTVARDLKDLAVAGFGIYSDDGRWRESDETRVPIPLTHADALALSLCLDALLPVGAGLETARAVAELREKVEAALPEAARLHADELGQTQMATFTAPAIVEEGLAEVLERGCRLEQSVRIRYRAFDGQSTERVVDPYTLWFADGSLYVIAFCHLRHAIRHFLVPRVLEAELLDDTFERDEAFDPRAHIQGGFGVWVGERHAVELVFPPESSHLAEERRLHASQQSRRLDDGSVSVCFEASGLPALARWVASMGGAVRPVAPPVLRDMVRDLLLAGLDHLGAKAPARALSPATGGAKALRDAGD